MQNSTRIHNETERPTALRVKNRQISVRTFSLFVAITFFALLLLPGISVSAEKKGSRKPPVQQKETALNDGTVLDYLKKAEDQLKKGELEASLSTLLKIHDYSEDVVKTVKYFQAQYEKVVTDSSVAQAEKEDIFLKLKRIGQLIPKYNNLREVSAYDIGLIYAKKGEAEKARKYLLEVLETAPFSTKADSAWMKTKKLLLGLYHLEGEF